MRSMLSWIRNNSSNLSRSFALLRRSTTSEVDIFQRVAQRNQVIAFGHGLRQRFRNERGLCQQVGDERLECFDVKPRLRSLSVML